jgi:hypothetical protein
MKYFRKNNLFAKALAATLALALIPNPSFAQSDAQKALDAAKVTRDEKIAEQKIADQRQAAIDNQKKAQEDTAKKNKSGSQTATLLGAALAAGGAVMVAYAVSCCATTNTHLLIAGLFTIAGGAGSMMAASAMNKTGNNATQNAGNLGSLGQNFGGPGSNSSGLRSNAGSIINRDGTPGNRSTDLANGDLGSGGNSIAINPDELTNGKVGEIFDKFEAQTGIKRDDFMQALASGKSPSELLAGIGGLSQSDLEKGMKDAIDANAGGSLGADDIENIAKDMGLSDLYADAKDSGDVDFSGGGGASRSPASASPASGLNLAGNLATTAAPSLLADDSGKIDLNNLSDQVRKQLEKEGRTGQSLFFMVTQRYRKVTPMLFGEDVSIGLQDNKTIRNDLLFTDESLSR